MSTKGQIGFGIQVYWAPNSAGSPGTWTKIAELLDVTDAAPKGETVKVKTSDAPTNTAGAPIVQKIGGWIDNSDLKAEFIYIPGGRAALEAIVMASGFFKVVYPLCQGQTGAGDVTLFPGYLTELGKQTKLDDTMKLEVTIAVSGAITYTQGS